jgi:hypothetical protein
VNSDCFAQQSLLGPFGPPKKAALKIAHDIPMISPLIWHKQNGGINSSASLRFYSMKFHLDLTATFVAAPWIGKKTAVFDE